MHQDRQGGLGVGMPLTLEAIHRRLSIRRRVIDPTARIENKGPHQRCLGVGEMGATVSGVADGGIRGDVRLDQPATVEQSQDREVDAGTL